MSINTEHLTFNAHANVYGHDAIIEKPCGGTEPHTDCLIAANQNRGLTEYGMGSPLPASRLRSGRGYFNGMMIITP